MSDQWLVKRISPDSVMSSWDTEAEAQTHCDQLNADYQTDNYYTEPFDPAQLANWPTKAIELPDAP